MAQKNKVEKDGRGLFIHFKAYDRIIRPIFENSNFSLEDTVRVHHWGGTTKVGVSILETADKRFNFKRMGAGNEVWIFEEYLNTSSVMATKILLEDSVEEFANLLRDSAK